MTMGLENSLTRQQPLKHNRYRIPKSRYDSVDLYISNDWKNRPEYNDTAVPFDEKVYERLRNHGNSPHIKFLISTPNASL